MKIISTIKDILKPLKPQICVVCGGLIMGGCYKDKWGQLFHAHHQVNLCASCGRVVAKDDTHLPYNRYVCSHCVRAVVRTSEHVKWVYDRVQMIFKSRGLELPANVPVEIKDAAEIAKLRGDNVIDVNNLGLTQSGGVGLFGVKLNHKVYMLDHLHKVIFGGTLAHELLHVWQNEHHIKLPSFYCEGFCNLGTYLLYRSIENEMTAVLVDNMMNDDDPIYGDGFRAVKAIYEGEGQKNLKKTLELLGMMNKK